MLSWRVFCETDYRRERAPLDKATAAVVVGNMHEHCGRGADVPVGWRLV